MIFIDFDTSSYGDLCFSMIFIDTHLALAWGGVEKWQPCKTISPCMRGWEGGAKPMQETLHEIKKKQSLTMSKKQQRKAVRRGRAQLQSPPAANARAPGARANCTSNTCCDRHALCPRLCITAGPRPMRDHQPNQYSGGHGFSMTAPFLRATEEGRP